MLPTDPNNSIELQTIKQVVIFLLRWRDEPGQARFNAAAFDRSGGTSDLSLGMRDMGIHTLFVQQ